MSEPHSAARRQALWKPILFAAVAAACVAGLGALTTDIGAWYLSLAEPSWKPPDIWFGPAWTLIFACAAIAGVLAWRRAGTKARREWTLCLFALNAFLNLLWSLLFFRLHHPDWALMEVGFLWASIALLIVYLGGWSPPSRWWLAPYLVWVSFAAVLNLDVVRLNSPF